MEYKYYNQFNLSKKLSKAISYIISKKEKADYVCKNISVIIPEHEGLVFSSPLDGYESFGGGLNCLSGAQINEINKKYGKYVDGTIEEEEYSFLVIMKKEKYETFSKFSFQSIEQLENALHNLSVFYEEYNGIFDSKTLIEKYPYLQEFFDALDKWREQTGRVTLDNNVLNESVKKVLSKKKHLRANNN